MLQIFNDSYTFFFINDLTRAQLKIRIVQRLEKHLK